MLEAKARKGKEERKEVQRAKEVSLHSRLRAKEVREERMLARKGQRVKGLNHRNQLKVPKVGKVERMQAKVERKAL